MEYILENIEAHPSGKMPKGLLKTKSMFEMHTASPHAALHSGFSCSQTKRKIITGAETNLSLFKNYC